MAQIQGPLKRTQGLVSPIINLNPESFLNMRRAPTVYDQAEQSTLWIQTSDLNGAPVNEAYINVGQINGQAQWSVLTTPGGAGVFTSLVVNPGPTSITGVTTVTGATTINGSLADNTTIGGGTNTGITVIGNTGNTSTSVLGANVTVSAAAAGQLNLGSSQTTGDIVVGAALTSGDIFIGSAGQTGDIELETNGTGAIIFSSQGNLRSEVALNTAAAYTVVLNANLGIAQMTGQVLAAAASQVLTITNNLVTFIDQPCLVTVANGGANDAQLTIQRVQMTVGAILVTVKNNGAQALNGNINVTFWLPV